MGLANTQCGDNWKGLEMNVIKATPHKIWDRRTLDERLDEIVRESVAEVVERAKAIIAERKNTTNGADG